MNKRNFIKCSIFGAFYFSLTPINLSLAETKNIINKNLTEAQKKNYV